MEIKWSTNMYVYTELELAAMAKWYVILLPCVDNLLCFMCGCAHISMWVLIFFAN
jgi:hypothetical protein